MHGRGLLFKGHLTWYYGFATLDNQMSFRLGGSSQAAIEQMEAFGNIVYRVGLGIVRVQVQPLDSGFIVMV